MAAARAQHRPNAIDGLQTKEQMVQFVKTEKTLHNISGMEIYRARPGQDDRSLPDWFYKVDIDGDGRTDLIMNGQWPILILDRGPKGYWVTALGSPGHDINSTRLVGIDTLHHPTRLLVQHFTLEQVDTLVFVKGGLFEYNPHPLKHFDFQGLVYTTGGCERCPVYSFAVGKKGHLEYQASDLNERQGTFEDSLLPAQLDTLVTWLRYLPLETLDTSYHLRAENGLVVYLDISYNGKIRHITDHGGMGLWGLGRIYNKFGLLHMDKENGIDDVPPAPKRKVRINGRYYTPPMIVREPDSANGNQ